MRIITKTVLTMFALAASALTTEIFAQNFPSSCTSKDLELVDAYLNNGDICGSCTAGSTVTGRHLIARISNKTGSTRTSFAFWGTLVLTDPDGTPHTRSINECAGPIPKNATTPIDFGEVTYTCGQSLRITDLHLAWTDASPGSKCPLDPTTINPKCGVLPEIIIVAGLNAKIDTTNATCLGGGTISVQPYGGTAPYSVTVSGVTKSVAAGGTATFTGLTASTTPYSISITDATTPTHCINNTNSRIIRSSSAPSVSGIGGAFTKTCSQHTSGETIGETPVSGYSYSWSPSAGLSNASIGNPTANPSSTTTYTVTKKDDATGCTNTKDVIVTVNTTAPTFSVCMVQPTLCANSGSVTINASGGSGFQYSIDKGAHYQSSNSFTGLASGSVTGIIVTNSDGCASDTASCNVQSDCSETNITSRIENSSTNVIATNDVKVKAYPNPFNDRVKFAITSPVSGNATLEVFNSMGQKVKTVYKGHINSGSQSFELTIPKKQQATLFYVFRVGDKKVTGKLLQLNN